MRYTKAIYLDGASNTPIDQSVLKAMKPYLSTKFVGNGMAAHNHGAAANSAIDQARTLIKQDLGCKKDTQVYFTSGATESNNWVIKAVTHNYLTKKSPRNVIFCSTQEHASVLNACKIAEQEGMRVIYISPRLSREEYVDNPLDFITAAKVDPNEVALVCMMAVNNETGLANRVRGIAQAAYKLNIPTLVDCTQFVSLGGEFMAICRAFPCATFMSFSGHKIYGPTGIGVLVSQNDALLAPMIVGGGQENGKRGGTSNTAAIIGLAAAVHEMREHEYMEHYRELYFHLVLALGSKLPKVFLNFWPDYHFNILSVNCSAFLDCEKLLKLDMNVADLLANICQIDVSAGSACDTGHDGKIHFSHVLRDLSFTDAQIAGTIRVSFTKFTTKEDLNKLIDGLIKIKKYI